MPQLLLHAILPTEAVEPPRLGLRGWPLRAVAAAGVVGWATEWRPEAGPLGRDDLLAHHALAQRALGVCLPVRLPTWLADEIALADLLRERQAALEVALAHVQGKAELAVTASWISDSAAPARLAATTPGRRFLEERRQRYASDDQRRAIAQTLADRLSALAGVLEAQHRVCPAETIALSSALLVPLAAAAGVRAAMPPAPDNVRILVNGPWPPYSFSALV